MEIETFREMSQYELGEFARDNPMCSGGVVSVKKYRVIIEEIPETRIVYRKRLQLLWEKETNHHHHQPLLSKARELGIELTGEMGAGREKNER